MTVIDIIILTIGLVAILYCIYQLGRNQEIFNIRIKWIDDDDLRHEKYTYESMLWPNRNNWFGLKYPKDKDYK